MGRSLQHKCNRLKKMKSKMLYSLQRLFGKDLVLPYFVIGATFSVRNKLKVGFKWVYFSWTCFPDVKK